jgi:hypothetical protein
LRVRQCKNHPGLAKPWPPLLCKEGNVVVGVASLKNVVEISRTSSRSHVDNSVENIWTYWVAEITERSQEDNETPLLTKEGWPRLCEAGVVLRLRNSQTLADRTRFYRAKIGVDNLLKLISLAPA